MKTEYRVKWKALWKNLSTFMSLAIIVPLVLFALIRFATHGFSLEKAFEYLSPVGFFYILIGAYAFSVLFSLLVALWFKVASVRIIDGWLYGRGYWGLKKKIPLEDVSVLRPFSSNGINAVVAETEYFGSVYISVYTEDLAGLLEVVQHHSKCENLA